MKLIKLIQVIKLMKGKQLNWQLTGPRPYHLCQLYQLLNITIYYALYSELYFFPNLSVATILTCLQEAGITASNK
jgi:hypothetical protein